MADKKQNLKVCILNNPDVFLKMWQINQPKTHEASRLQVVKIHSNYTD